MGIKNSEGSARNVVTKSKEYWTNKLHHYTHESVLRQDRRILHDGYEREEIHVTIDNEISQKLLTISKGNDILILTVLATVLQINLYKYSQKSTISIGVPIYGKGNDNNSLHNVVLPLIANIDDRITFKEMIIATQKMLIESYKNQYFSLESILRLISTDDYSIMDLASINIMMKSVHSQEAIDTITHAPNNELSLCIERNNSDMDLTFIYNKALLKKSTIETLIKYYLKLLRDGLSYPQDSIKELEIITEDEKNKILYAFNDTDNIYSNDKTIHAVFEEQAKHTPHYVAASYMEEQLTYETLNKRANQLARRLRNQGISPNTVVGIMVERSLEMMIGIMAILKAGGAYLPIDPNYPKERVRFMLEDSGAELLLLKETYRDRIEDIEISNIKLDDNSIYRGMDSNLSVINTSNDLAYIIYTSGSTGQPKGTMIEHHSVINKIEWRQQQYALHEKDVILQKTPFTFDVSVWELFWWSFTGAKICFLIHEGEKDPKCIVDTIYKNKVSIIHFVPSMLHTFLDYVEGHEDRIDKLSSIKQVFTSGETLTPKLVHRFNKLLNHKNIKLSNLYGPTEATIEVSYYNCLTDAEIGVIPIGKPIHNVKLYVVDKNMNLQPIGVQGELCISGVGLSRGYINRQELTEKKFIPNPFHKENRNHRMIYKTGDLARWLPDGNIEFIGRKDHQVKIRGYRIELGEIESALIKYDYIKEAIVLPKKDKENVTYLSAYILLEQPIEVRQIREHLSGLIPEYMIPQQYIQLDEVPINHNGKIDRKALYLIDKCMDSNGEYEEPRNEIEEKMTHMWCEILQNQKIGITDNFFELGGHSLKVNIFINRMSLELNVNIALLDVFQNQTIKQIYDNLLINNKEMHCGWSDNLVLLKRGGHKNLFCIHAAQGTVDIYVKLCKYLDPSFNCRGIKIDKIDGYAPIDISIQELAERYIHVMKSVQPEGPYSLIGWSLGGNIAFEMVRQLEKVNEKVAFLGLMDTAPPINKLETERVPFTSEFEKQFINEMFNIDEAELDTSLDIEVIWIRTLEKLIDDARDISYLARNIDEDILKYVPNYKQMNIDEFIYAMNIRRSLTKSLFYFTITSKIETPIHVFKAVQSRVKVHDWIQYCHNKVELYEIQGNHYTMLQEENNEEIARIINKIINNTLITNLSVNTN